MSSKKFEVNCGNNFPDIREGSQKNYIDFWASQAKSLHWFKNWDRTLNWNLPFAKWFEGGLINASYNLLDVKINGKKIDENKIYSVATSDYLLNGGDKMTFFSKSKKNTTLDYKIRNVLIDYFKEVDTVNFKIDNRFIIKN